MNFYYLQNQIKSLNKKNKHKFTNVFQKMLCLNNYNMNNNAQQRLEIWGAKLGDLDKTLQEKPRCCKRKCLAGGIPAQLLHDRRLDFYWTKEEQVLLSIYYSVLSSFTSKKKHYINLCIGANHACLNFRLPKKGC